MFKLKGPVGYGVLLMGIAGVASAGTGFTVLTTTLWAQVRNYIFTPGGEEVTSCILGPPSAEKGLG